MKQEPKKKVGQKESCVLSQLHNWKLVEMPNPAWKCHCHGKEKALRRKQALFSHLKTHVDAVVTMGERQRMSKDPVGGNSTKPVEASKQNTA